MILRCRFHCKNAGFEDLTTRILHFLVPRIPWEFWYYMGFDGFFLGCTFCCAFFPAMPLDILVLENVSWWYWGAGSTAKMQVLKTLQQGSYIFWFLGFPGNSGIIWFWWVFSRLYILLCILSSNAFGHFGLGKCKLMILRCRFHGKNAGFEDLTTRILHFLVPRIPWEFWYYMGFDGFFLGCTFCCAFFPAMPLDILVLENVSWWYWGAGSTAKMQVLKTLQQGSYIFWFLGFPGNSGIIWVFDVFFLGCTFCCAFFPAMPLDILVLENVSWWYWGAGSTAKMQVFEDLTTRILHFLVPRIPWEFWYYMGFDGFFLGCTFCCAFFPAMPLDILVLENVSWWYWGAGSTAKMQVLKTLQQGSYIFWFLGFPGNSGIIWVLMGFF